MKRSTERFLTTHTGSLPRPDDLVRAMFAKEEGVPVDAAGVMYDGTKIDGPAGLRAGLLKHQDVFLQTFTENLMTYALGRRVETYDMPAVRSIVRRAANTDYRLSSFVLGIVNSAAFQKRSSESIDTVAGAR